MVRFVGTDPSGVPRVFADDENHDTAYDICIEQVMSYIQNRPDTGPMKKWHIGRDYRIK